MVHAYASPAVTKNGSAEPPTVYTPASPLTASGALVWSSTNGGGGGGGEEGGAGCSAGAPYWRRLRLAAGSTPRPRMESR